MDVSRFIPLLLTCVLCGCGSSSSPPVTTGEVEVLYGAPNNAQINSFVTVIINPATGGFNSVSVATSPYLSAGGIITVNERFLYVSAGAKIFGYSINQSTGALTALAGSPLTLPSSRSAESLASPPNGDFLYAADAAGGVDAFQIDGSTGALTPIPGAPFGTGASYGVAVSSTGNFLYATDETDGEILAFEIGSTGALTPISGSPFVLPGAATSKPRGIVQAGGFVYAALNGLNEIAAYSINSSTGSSSNGSLVAVPGSPFPAGEEPATFAATGSFLYAANWKDGSVSGYSINAVNGALITIPGSPFFRDITTLTVDSSGKFLYLGSSVGIEESSIDSSTGALSQSTGGVSNDGSLWMTVVQLPQRI